MDNYQVNIKTLNSYQVSPLFNNLKCALIKDPNMVLELELKLKQNCGTWFQLDKRMFMLIVHASKTLQM